MTEKSNEVLVLGVDPGTAVTGYGIVARGEGGAVALVECGVCLLYTSPSPRDRQKSRMPSSA